MFPCYLTEIRWSTKISMEYIRWSTKITNWNKNVFNLNELNVLKYNYEYKSTK